MSSPSWSSRHPSTCAPTDSNAESILAESSREEDLDTRVVHADRRPRSQGPLEAVLDEVGLQLHELALGAHLALATADGVGIMLRIEECSVFAGSNPFADSIDQLQHGLQNGPSFTAVASQQVVRSRTIGTGEQRWDRFTPQASSLGLRSVASVPVRADGQVIGSLSLYGREAVSLDANGTNSLMNEAEQVGRALAGAWLKGVSATKAQVLVQAVHEREDIEIGVGLLMGRHTMTAADARILIGQLAAQDQVSTVAAARSLFS